ncbi:hypothetical protein D9D20_26010 [Escherichia coli]|nr:hypothetical protein [Escherichia coli]
MAIKWFNQGDQEMILMINTMYKHIVLFIIPLYGYCVDSAISTITFILVKSMRQFNIPTELSYIISFIINILYR